MEQAFNRDPKVTDGSVGGVTTVEGGYLTMTIAKRAGVNYIVQSGNAPSETSFSAANTTILTDNATTLKVRDNVPVGEQPSRVMRVKVVNSP